MSNLTSSVAICTYNGARYIQEQLESILQQSYLPDELLLFDDDSSDQTVEIAHAILSSQTSIGNWQIRKNEKNLGYVKNFEQACTACSQDIIFLCDQDDIWCPDKVASFLEVLADPAVSMVFSDGWVCDIEGKPFGSLFESFSISPSEIRQINRGQALPLFCNRTYATGAASAIRRTLVNAARPFPDSGWHHDEWLALTAAACESIRAIESRTFYYRLHANNQVGIPSLTQHVHQPLRMRFKGSLDGSFANACGIKANTLQTLTHALGQHLQSNPEVQPAYSKLSRMVSFLAYRSRSRSFKWFLELPEHLPDYAIYTPHAAFAFMLDTLSAISGGLSKTTSSKEAR